MSVCACVEKLKKIHSSEVSVFPLAKSVNPYVWVDLEIQAKFRIWGRGKYTNFVIALNVFLLVVCSPVLAVVSIWTWRNVWGSTNALSESCPAESERKREKAFKVADYIGIHVPWPVDKIKMRRRSWKHTAPETIWFTDVPLLLFREQVSHGSYFSRIFLLLVVLDGHLKNIGV